MQKESLDTNKNMTGGPDGTGGTGSSRGALLTGLVVIVLTPAALLLSWKMGSGQYWLTSVVIMLLSMVPFFVRFERRKPSARELVILSTMCAIAVVSRAAFIMLPSVKPMLGIIMIAGIALGAEAGFLTGAISAFVSNFIFGQGPWTPWQMFAFGFSGFIAGILASKGILKPEKRVPVAVFGGLLIFLIIGPILDTCSVLLATSVANADSAILAIYIAGVPVNAVHAAGVAVTLLLLCKPMCEKLERIKVKYGLMK